MKRVLVVTWMFAVGAFGVFWNWSCINNSQPGPTFPDAINGIAGPTATPTFTYTPCGFPGNTCTPTPTSVMCLATPIAVGTTVIGSTTFASNNFISTCGGSGNDVVYRFTLPVARSVTISTCSVNTTFDTVLAVLSSCNPVTQLGCNDDGACGGLHSLIQGPLPAGTYWIVVDGFGGASGQYELGLQ